MGETALIPIPADLTPATEVCYQIHVPNDSQWKGMFWGALYMLTVWSSYDRDDAHSGKTIADTWKTLIDSARASTCGGSMTLDFRQTDCLLEYSLDGGLTWATAYDGAACLLAAIADGTILGGSAIDDAIAAGKIAPGNQQGPTPPPDTGFCKTFFVTLSANQKWLCPTPINGNYTITIEQVQGGWTPDPTHYWYCPSGETYTLGGCASGTGATDSGDPLNTVNHMRLVGNYGTTWFDAFNNTYVVPNTVTTPQNLFLQANDSDITNNLGSITCKVTVCHASWEHVWDFTVSDGGWSAFTNPIVRAAYVSSRGWHRAHESGDYSDRVTFYINTPGSVNVTMSYMEAQVESCTGVSNIGLFFAGVAPYVGCTSLKAVYTHEGNANQVLIDAVMNSGADCYVHKVILRGLGVDPWA